MKISRRMFLKYLAFAGAIAAMGFSGCLSSPEPTPTPTPTPISTPKPPASEPTPTSKQETRTFFYVGTEMKKCPLCGYDMYLRDVYGTLFWVCQNQACGYIERVAEPEILKKYGYST